MVPSNSTKIQFLNLSLFLLFWGTISPKNSCTGFMNRQLSSFVINPSQTNQLIVKDTSFHAKKEDTQDDDDDDDPWAGNRLYTDESDLMDDEDEDEFAWMNDIPGARDLSPDPELLEKWKRGDGNAGLLKDDLYSSFDDDKFIQMQKEYSAKARGMTVEEYEEWSYDTQKTAMDATNPKNFITTAEMETISSNIKSLDQHLRHQSKIFDEMAEFFNSDEAVPDDVKPVLKHMMGRLIKQMTESRFEQIDRLENRKPPEERDDSISSTQKQNKKYRILDVGCGTGALFPYYLEAANNNNLELQITGVDLSEKMSKMARINAESALDEKGGRHEFTIETSDFVEFVKGEELDKYDAVVINACFGNFFDQGKFHIYLNINYFYSLFSNSFFYR